jgi:FkbM family methyltransferase
MTAWSSLKSVIKKGLRARGVYVYRALPRGFELAHDLRSALPHQRFEIIFDVGANIGQSAASFLDDFPAARIWCFEPSATLHSDLARRFSGNSRVICERCALSSSQGEAQLKHTLDPTMFHLTSLANDKLPANVTFGDCETVIAETLDRYCHRMGISHIDFLKVDTEGHDLEILRGANGLLAAGTIACLQSECSMSVDNVFHRAFEEIKSFVEPFGYRLFGIYDQAEDWSLDKPNLRRINAVFVAPVVMCENRISFRRTTGSPVG